MIQLEPCKLQGSSINRIPIKSFAVKTNPSLSSQKKFLIFCQVIASTTTICVLLNYFKLKN